MLTVVSRKHIASTVAGCRAGDRDRFRVSKKSSFEGRRGEGAEIQPVIEIVLRITGEIGKCDENRNAHRREDGNGHDTGGTAIGTPR